MQTRKILIADDDRDFRSILAEQFGLHDEFHAIHAGSARETVDVIQKDHPDIVLMDIRFSDRDGRDAIKDLRKSGYNNPIIILTHEDAETEVLAGFEAGANDYVYKPFRFSILLARIRALLRLHDLTEDAAFPIGRYTFHPSAKTLTASDDEKLRLTEKEAAILLYLYRAKDGTVARDELLREVWGYNANVATHTLETHIYRLRQKIEIDPANAQLLLTEIGGYRLNP